MAFDVGSRLEDLAAAVYCSSFRSVFLDHQAEKMELQCHKVAIGLHTRALAYVPSMPNNGTGGLESVAGVAYVRRPVRAAVRGAADACRETTARKLVWLARLESMVLDD